MRTFGTRDRGHDGVGVRFWLRWSWRDLRERWLLVTAGLFAASAVLYVLSSRRAAPAHSAS